jgi:hypothetical protein
MRYIWGGFAALATMTVLFLIGSLIGLIGPIELIIIAGLGLVAGIATTALVGANSN